MAAITMELRKVIEAVGGIENLGLNDYPIFEESYRPTLNKRIVDHFKYREIGHETIDMFIDRLSEKMNLIMPVYNKLYETTLYEFDALTSTKLSTNTTSTGTESSTADATSSSSANNSTDTTSKSRSVSSEFPQLLLSGNEDYANSATDSVGDSTVAGTASDESVQNQVVEGNRTGNSTTEMVGYTRSPAELVLLYRETLINVDMTILGELEVLFMQVWNTGDEYGDYPSYQFPFYYPGAF